MTLPAKWKWGALLFIAGCLALACAAYGIFVVLPHTIVSDETALDVLTPEESAHGKLDISLRFPAEDPLNFTCVLSATPCDSYPAPADAAATPVFRLSTDSGKLTATISHERSAAYRCAIRQTGIIHRRQPNGEVHTLRHILLSCEQDMQDEKRIYLQQLELDIAARTADSIPCTIPQEYAELTAQEYQSLTPSTLPTKHGSDPIRRDLSRLVHALAAIDSPALARAAAPELLAFSWQLARKAPKMHLPWPESWDTYSADARAAAVAITPILVYLQENNCFDSGELAAMINSPAFTVIFGHRFTAPPTGPVQEEPIRYIQVPAHE